MTNTVNVTACDNELIMVAYQGGDSYELCRIKSGNSYPVSVTVNITAGKYTSSIVLNGVNSKLDSTITPTIPAGSYNLVLVGLNWGGPYNFAGKIFGVPFNSNGASGDGVQYHSVPVSFTVA